MIDNNLTRVVVSDVHGNIDALRDVLQSVGVINDNDERQDGFYVVQVGDLANGGGRNNWYGSDVRCVEWSLPFFDEILIGNHELWFSHGLEAGLFGGMDKDDAEFGVLVRRLVREGYYTPATAIDGWLITHAGLHPYFINNDSPFQPGMTAEEVSEAINDLWIERLITRTEMDPFDAIGYHSGGITHIGGIFWLRPSEWYSGGGKIYGKSRGYTPTLKQLVGHTPNKSGEPEFNRWQNVWYTDPGKGRVSAMVKKADDEDWTPYVSQYYSSLPIWARV